MTPIHNPSPKSFIMFVPSSSAPDHKFDVFLSFRGFDTRLNFTDHLRKALTGAKITAFYDDHEIETGEDLKPELENAIKASRASITVLSKNYASSTWCLDELVLILEQPSDHIIVPIFYHVEPTDVKKQQSSFGDAMTKHRQRMEAETNAEKKSQLGQKLDLWSAALTRIGNLKGHNAKGRLETELLEEIVSNIHRRLGVPLSIAPPVLIGMKSYIKFISLWLKNGSSDTVDILTILGMGGIGKTSLAKNVYGLHCRMFQRSSFIEDIGKSDQRTILLDLRKRLGGENTRATSIQVQYDFVNVSRIENVIAQKKVFLVLDGIDRVDQLDMLIGNTRFHPGSKIIITTNDASLTPKCALFKEEPKPKHVQLLLRGLDKIESLELLSSQAFMCKNPKEGYEEVSNKLVEYCEGLPLALKVLGKSLCNRTVAQWEDFIQVLQNEISSHIKDNLQRSFDTLPFNNDKELFKHIACFFVGKDRESTETILKACKIPTVAGIKNLIDRCLLRIEGDNKLMMHQLLQKMGRDVVRHESLKKPWKRSLLWCNEESFKVLKYKKGKGNLLGLALDVRMLEKKLHSSSELHTEALRKMDNLMLLQLDYVQLNGSYKNFPEELRWLCMHRFPLQSIPLDLPMENLVALDMSYSNFESFGMSFSNPHQLENRPRLTESCSKGGKQLLGSLKILDLSFCEQLRTLGGFLEFPALERLILVKCKELTEVCGTIENCVKLVLIDLSYCNMLKKLPRAVVKLKKVETLLLDGCNLGEFPIDMNLPEMVIPRDFRSFVVSLSSSLACLSLKNNNLCNESFPMDFSSLSMLKELYLDGNSIMSLPNCVRSLPRLEKLSMEKCLMLKTFEQYPPCTLKELKFDRCHSLQKIVFDKEMSPLTFSMNPCCTSDSRDVIEGMLKVDAMKLVPKEVVCGLGWTNLESVNEQQMVYEFGIFSTIYGGEELPNWISDHISEESSISFNIPSSSHKLRGLNFCYVFMARLPYYLYLPRIIISNKTKNHTWIYHRYSYHVMPHAECEILLSHWMFGKNEMEDGDQIMITISKGDVNGIRKCGVSLVYDDDQVKMEEEDPLSDYKLWNHIIGGNLSPFQTTPGEYILDVRRFFCGTGFQDVNIMKGNQRTFNAHFLAGLLQSTTYSPFVRFQNYQKNFAGKS
ncbi:disease resistance protein RML1B-like [Cynara cardunculus var. scolymus]|uniref:disease resistance protein RML1B-like n=1 Tax=Cynara cardunculus var. scolymus TaxID=59895 RepID=UPI000D62A3A6|nr:disease resistance protein RML1B-like [Cynara cardunculus var. scolymus]